MGGIEKIGVPERVIADLVASAGQVLEVARGQLLLVEETVGRIGAGEHEEGRRVAELRVSSLEGLEDPHRAIRIHDPLSVLLDELELSRRGIIEGEDDGRRASGERDLAIEEGVQRHQPVAALPEALEVATEIVRRAGPALLGLVDLVVLEDHHAPELVRRELSGRGDGRPRQGTGEQAGAERAGHGLGMALAVDVALGGRAEPV